MKISNIKNQKTKNKGFSIIELLIYIALISLFVTGAINFAWDIIYGREKTYGQQATEQSARIALSKISYEIKRAKNIQSVSGNEIILNNETGTTSISLSSGILQIISGGSEPYSLTSNEVEILEPPQTEQPLFKDLGTSDNNSRNIAVNITVKESHEVSSQIPAQTTLSESIELNSQFNQARSLLVNASNSFLSDGYKDLINMSLANSASSNITVDSISVSWTNGGQGVNLTQIQINTSPVWTGTASSGEVVNIQNTTIPRGTESVPINFFRFSSNMSGTIISITFIMTDGSKSKTTIDFT